ncbi:hypothetical protein Slin15195_G090050 [Septoria linicola]|uniref:Uncharacterized protein n=1 Tax=Septoria linicola TaxID=215465 RepID=A0A9Q9B1T9_9PEZI|nr:hypothetical protein Slin15195_G090050 [Septoria linicola]
MRFSSSSIIAATTYLAICARALPHPAPPATYNVVDVGGPTDTPSTSATGETVKTTLPAQTTYTEVAPAATITTTPQQVVTGKPTTTSSSQWTVVIGNVPTTTPSSTSSSTSSVLTSKTSSTSAPASTCTPETATHTADDGFYHPPGNDGQYVPFKAVATPSAATTGYSAGAAAASGWAQPWNATNNYVKRGFAAPSGKLPSPNVVKHLDLL